MYQSTAISSYFRTLGYLIPIISVLCVPILPRAKFVQLFALNLIAMCLGAAVSLLIIWSSIQARNNTSSAASPTTSLGPPPYNSSQSAVCGVWLFFNIWAANFMRAALPSFTMPVIIYGIFVSISATTAVTLVTTAMAEAFVKQLLCAMLFGLGLATGVSLLVFPVTSRRVVMAEFKAIIGVLRKAGMEERKFLEDFLANQGLGSKVTADSLSATTSTIRTLTAKARGDLVYAKRELAWGHLDAADLSETFSLICNVMIPM